MVGRPLYQTRSRRRLIRRRVDAHRQLESSFGKTVGYCLLGRVGPRLPQHVHGVKNVDFIGRGLHQTHGNQLPVFDLQTLNDPHVTWLKT